MADHCGKVSKAGRPMHRSNNTFRRLSRRNYARKAWDDRHYGRQCEKAAKTLEHGISFGSYHLRCWIINYSVDVKADYVSQVSGGPWNMAQILNFCFFFCFENTWLISLLYLNLRFYTSSQYRQIKLNVFCHFYVKPCIKCLIDKTIFEKFELP